MQVGRPREANCVYCMHARAELARTGDDKNPGTDDCSDAEAHELEPSQCLLHLCAGTHT